MSDLCKNLTCDRIEFDAKAVTNQQDLTLLLLIRSAPHL